MLDDGIGVTVASVLFTCLRNCLAHHVIQQCPCDKKERTRVSDSFLE
jgi:hypothetical protein